MNENNHSRVKTKTKRLQKPVKTSNDFSYILPSTFTKPELMDFSPNKNRFLNLKFLLGSTLYKNYYLLLCWIDWVSSAHSLFSPFTHSLFPLSSHISEKRRVQNRIAFRQRTNSICLLSWLTDVHTRTSKKFRVIFFYYAIIILNYILGLWWDNEKIVSKWINLIVVMLYAIMM